MRVVMLDNYDSFTFNLVQYLMELGARVDVYRNDATTGGHWLTVRAVDPRLRRDAIGAHVLVHSGGRTMLRLITRSGSYLSSSDPRAFFGLGEAETIDGIDVRWPDGLVERFPGGSVRRHVVLVRGEGEAAS